MKKRLKIIIAILFISMVPPAANAAADPPGVIFDTDMWGDIDDVLALAMLHTLQDRGEARILAVTSSTDDKWCAAYIDALDHFYGHGEIPVGTVRDGVTGEATRLKYPFLNVPQENYTQYIAERRQADRSLMYPRTLEDGSRAEEAGALLRKSLVAQPDNSVVVIQVGFSTNLARLLESKGDQISPLDGVQLVRKKVRFLSVMAGSYAEATFQGKNLPKGMPEFNLALDPPSAQQLFAKWPTPIVASGIEIGASMFFKGSDIERYFAYAKDHPVADTYRYTDRIYRSKATPPGVLHDHATFDLTAVLYAIRPDEGYFSLSEAGEIEVRPDGSSYFNETPKGNRRYLKQSEPQRTRALEAMTMLVSQPPVRRRYP